MIKKHKYIVMVPYTLTVPVILEHEEWSETNQDVYDYEMAIRHGLQILKEQNCEAFTFQEFEIRHDVNANIGVFVEGVEE